MINFQLGQFLNSSHTLRGNSSGNALRSVTRSITGSVFTLNVKTIASLGRIVSIPTFFMGSHYGMLKYFVTLERHPRHSHAERGNEIMRGNETMRGNGIRRGNDVKNQQEMFDD